MNEGNPFPAAAADANVAEAIAAIPSWRHRRQDRPVITPGTEDSDAELQRLRLPTSLDGQRVLDIGCSDGLYSFEAERRGAHEVVAIDDESSLLAGGVNGFQTARALLNSKVGYRVRDASRS